MYRMYSCVPTLVLLTVAVYAGCVLTKGKAEIRLQLAREESHLMCEWLRDPRKRVLKRYLYDLYGEMQQDRVLNILVRSKRGVNLS